MRAVGALLVAALGITPWLSGCAAPYDDDGERAPAAAAPAAEAAAASDGPRRRADATRVVVDTDLGGDDLVALAFLLRHPAVDVDAVTIAATGLVGCNAGARVVAGLLTALDEAPVPVGCGRSDAGRAGRRFPDEWRAVAATGTGTTPAEGTPAPARTAADLLADRARSGKGLVVVALGPLTNLADLAQDDPAAYRRLDRVHAMAGSVDGPAEGEPVVDGVAEWNAAVDPESLAAVLSGPTPVTLVPEDAVPVGTPAALAAAPDVPVVSQVAATVEYPAWWDLAAAAALVEPDAGTLHWGTWTLDDQEPGRLRHEGPGPVRVYRDLDLAQLEAAYGEAFGSG